MSHARWKLLPLLSSRLLSQAGELSPLLLQLLYNRGITQPAHFDPFMTADERLCTDPFLLPDMPLAVNRVYRAILSGEDIVIYGDFDVDGICATTVLVQSLSALGAKVAPYIPHRLEGYGLAYSALEGLRQQGTSLVITADCGISDYDEVEKAQSLGIDMLITDHHTLTNNIPPAVAVVNPKRASSFAAAYHLAGVGVAFKLVQALFQSKGKERWLSQLLDLVALGTIADMSPLVGDNRYLVKRGLEVINRTPRPGLAALIQNTGLIPGNIDARNVSWVLAPRLNAAGRLDQAANSYQLLQATSIQLGLQLAVELEAKNAERQRLTKEVLDQARQAALAQQDSRLLFMGQEDFPSGVVGIVAGRLVEEFNRPAFVLELGEETSRGSARSIPEFDVVAALKRCSSYLTRFGGHPLAAGYTLPSKNIPLFHQHLLEIASQQLEGLDLCPTFTIDAEIALSQLNGELFHSLQKLAPFGIGNPVPTFISRGVKVVDCQTVGSDGGHIRLKLKEDGVVWQAIGFRLSSHSIAPEVDIVYNLTLNHWGGQAVLELNLLDIAPAKPRA